MTPSEIYPVIRAYSGDKVTVICNIHSACAPVKGKKYMCIIAGSKHPVIDFDFVRTEADKRKSVKSRKSVDAVALTPSQKTLCFVELKSWELLIKNKGTEEKVKKKASKYTSDLPLKLSDSISICQEIIGNSDAFNGCRMLYVLVTDISVDDNGLDALNADLSALAGISSNLNILCNRLSKNIMNDIPNVETRYWECREFDGEMAKL